MTSSRAVYIVLAFSIIFSPVLFVGCKEPKLDSAWRDREIRVDGTGIEWQGCAQYYDEDSRTVVGLMNDANHLYLLLSTHDRERKRQILAFGLTVWFDPEEGKERVFGIRFPVGMPRHKRPMPRTSGDDDAGFLKRVFDDPKMERQLLGPESCEQKTLLVWVVGKYGIETRVDDVEGNLIYELKVPLTKTEQIRYGVRTGLAKRIGVGFEIARPNVEKMQKPFGKGGGGQRGGGPGRMGGKPPGGMGSGGPPEGMRGRNDRKPPEPFELWTRVRLAPGPASPM